ncbi:MAG: serine hydrolase [Synoicihabitans sp.]
MKTVILILLASVGWISSFGKPPADIQQRLDTYVGTEPGGIAVAWVDQDGVSFFSAGTTAAEDGRPITADTQFEIGSITKAFNGLLLAESVKAGKVNLKDPAEIFLLSADDPARSSSAKITLQSLATHRAGLPRLPFNIGPNPDGNPDPYADYTRADLMEAFRQHGPTAPVGMTFAYSNLGAAVLGEALAAAWGVSYEEVLQTNVLTPVGMNETSLSITGRAKPSKLAPGHSLGAPVPNWQFQAFAPAGGLLSSPRDLSIFLQTALGLVDSPLHESIVESTQRLETADGVGGSIGQGWFLAEVDSHDIAWHNGGTGGYRSFLGFSRASRKGIVVLTNRSTGVNDLGFNLLGASAPRPRIPRVGEAPTYVGRYPLSPAFAIDITTDRDRLFLQATGQPKLALNEKTKDRFTVVGVPAEVSFERNSSGAVDALVLHQNGAKQRAPREDLPPPPVEVSMPPEILAEYVGEYPIAPKFVLSISMRQNRLFIQASGQAELELFAKAKDEFFYKVVDAQVSFTRDETGEVVGLVLHQNGREMPATKTK